MNRKFMKYSMTILGVIAAALLLLPTNTEAAPKKHTVTFIYGDRVYEQKVADGGYAKIPTDTSIPGFTFLGWSDSAVNVQQDKIILGMYATNIPYADLTNSFSSIKKVNENISAPFLPEWSIESPETGIPGVTCIVRWYNSWDMKLTKIDVVPYGMSLANPIDPVVPGINFVGWEGTWTNVTEDRAIKAWGTRIEDIGQADQTKENVILTEEKVTEDITTKKEKITNKTEE